MSIKKDHEIPIYNNEDYVELLNQLKEYKDPYQVIDMLKIEYSVIGPADNAMVNKIISALEIDIDIDRSFLPENKKLDQNKYNEFTKNAIDSDQEGIFFNTCLCYVKMTLMSFDSGYAPDPNWDYGYELNIERINPPEKK